MRYRPPLLAVCALCIALPSLSEGLAVPETLPLCLNPQQYAGLMPTGATRAPGFSPLVWNGKDFALAYVEAENGHLYFRRFFADGTPAGPAVVVSALDNATDALWRTGLIWNGTGYGLAWIGSPSSGQTRGLFCLLDANGSRTSPELEVSLAGGPTAQRRDLALAWSGSAYCVVWAESTSGAGYDLLATLVDADATISGNGTLHDLVIAGAPEDQNHAAIAWSAPADRFCIVWEDMREGYIEIRSRLLALDGGLGGDQVIMLGGVYPSLAGNPNGLAMSWMDARYDNAEISFARLTPWGTLLGTDVRLTNDPALSAHPCVTFTGAEYGVFWQDQRTGDFSMWFQRVDANGSPQGGNVQATLGSGLYNVQAAFAQRGFLLSMAGWGNGSFVEPFGCASDVTPPTCPGGFVVYGIAGTTATVAWLPSGDAESDLAYYQVYRDAAPLAKTSGTYFNDSGLVPNRTYAYAVEPVNAEGLQNFQCTSTFYVQTNPSLVLQVNKNAPDAVLNWTGGSLGVYNVFRGTSPQVMLPIGTATGQSFTDPEALMSTAAYFYSVDEPGEQR